MPNINTMTPSKYLKKGDVDENGTVATIKGLALEEIGGEGNKESKWVMYFNEFEKPLVMNKTNLDRAAHIIGSEETDDWIGKQVNVFFDPYVEYMGEMKGGIRLKPADYSAPVAETEYPAPF